MRSLILTTEKAYKDITMEDVVKILGPDCKEVFPFKDTSIVVLCKAGFIDEKYAWMVNGCKFYGPVILCRTDLYDVTEYFDFTPEDVEAYKDAYIQVLGN